MKTAGKLSPVVVMMLLVFAQAGRVAGLFIIDGFRVVAAWRDFDPGRQLALTTLHPGAIVERGQFTGRDFPEGGTMQFRRSLVLALILFVMSPLAGGAQDYILRPGPRGFDSRFNRYGATEKPAARPATGDRFDPSQTNVKVELLMQSNGGALDAQRWSRTFAEMGYPVRIRQPILDDKVEITETTRGPLRFVTVIGSLDSWGNVIFPNRRFSPGESDALKDWLDELKTYGAQGSPEGRPLWGLNRAQFEAIYAALSHPVDGDVAGLPLADALAKLRLPREYPLRLNADAKAALDAPGQNTKVSRSIEGLSTGTALAFVLNEFRLTFRPERTPEGTLELEVAPLPVALPKSDDDATNLFWPVGWKIEERTAPDGDRRPVKDEDAEPPRRVQLAPGLFQQREALELNDMSLTEAFATIERETRAVVLFDTPDLSATGIDPTAIRVTSPPRNTSWHVVLRSIAFRNRLRHELRRDEAGRPVIWMTAMVAGR